MVVPHCGFSTSAPHSFRRLSKEKAQNGQTVVAIAGAGVNTLSCRFVLHKEKCRRGTSPPLEPFLVLDCLCRLSEDRARWVAASGRWFELRIWLSPRFTRLVPCTLTHSLSHAPSPPYTHSHLRLARVKAD